jgi:hypothetical protein
MYTADRPRTFCSSFTSPARMMVKTTRAFTRPARTPSVTLERIRPAARASSTSGSRRIAMNFWWMRRLSSIPLILGDTAAGTKPVGKGRKKACGSIAPWIRRTRIMSWSPNVGYPSVSWKSASRSVRVVEGVEPVALG